MSIEKVNRYKKDKANRKKILKKEKRHRILGEIAGGLVVLALVGWMGHSIYGNVTKNIPVAQTPIHLDAISDYLSALNTADTVTDTE
ncbi:hypothetical protein FACS1894111_03280 [Clostridia bacterium]|nr:hypothetical protein FACS1894111_03280 [Clostridia bacterium]